MKEVRQKNQGEGNAEADRKYRDDASRFVQSEKGMRKIAEAGNLSRKEEKKLGKVAEKSKSHARDEDPAIKYGSGGSQGDKHSKQKSHN